MYVKFGFIFNDRIMFDVKNGKLFDQLQSCRQTPHFTLRPLIGKVSIIYSERQFERGKCPQPQSLTSAVCDSTMTQSSRKLVLIMGLVLFYLVLVLEVDPGGKF